MIFFFSKNKEHHLDEIVQITTHVKMVKGKHPVRLAYQPPASSTFLSQQTSYQQPASSTLLSEQTSTNHQPPANRTGSKPSDS
jgi:hypothetical protein